MVEFWKDYAQLCKESGEFYKKHCHRYRWDQV